MEHQENKGRKAAKEVLIQGIPYRYNDPPFMVREYYRCRITVRNPKSGRKEKDLGVVEAKAIDTLNKKINEIIHRFATENLDTIISWIKAGDFNPTLNDWYVLANDRIMDMIILSSKEECDILWSKLDTVGNIRTSQIMDGVKFTNLIKVNVAAAFGKKPSSHVVSSDERFAWKLLSAVIETLCAEEIIENNPIKSLARKKSILPTTVSSRALHQRSFSASEMSEYILHCIKEEDDDNIRCALILRALLGPTVYEVCGLNLDSFKTIKGERGALEIVREYYQERGKPPVLRERLDSLNSYRRIMCSLFLFKLMSSHKKARKKEGAKSDSPLFVWDGARLEPDKLKAVERGILNKVLGMKGISKQRGDFIRSNAEYYFINECGFTSAETETLLGRDREHTYARYYVDWNNPLVMHHLACKLDRWHSKIIRMCDGMEYPKSSLKLIVLEAKDKAILRLSCEGAFYLSLSSADKE